MEVHPPEHGIHSWRDFFVHMGTICLGLLVAIGLEQSVEWAHRRHERHLLLEQLDAEHQQTLRDAEFGVQYAGYMLRLEADKIAALQAAIAQTAYQAPPVSAPPYNANQPADPVWRAIKTAGTASLLPQKAVIANSEIETVLDDRKVRYLQSLATQVELTRACGDFPLRPDSAGSDYTHFDKKDLQQCLGTMRADYNLGYGVLVDNIIVVGAEKAIEAGETNIDRISDLEEQETERTLSQLHLVMQ